MKPTSAAPFDFSVWEKKVPRLPVVDRDAYILGACRGRKVFHLGAADSPMTAGKARRGELLHQRLMGHCKTLVGFDIDVSAIEMLRREYNIQNIYPCDLDRQVPTGHGRAELLVNGDIVEHVNSPGCLLRACNELLEMNGLMVLTTINALSAKQCLRALIGREPVHPDHVAYYSFATLGTLGARFGFQVVECRFFAYPCVSRITATAFRWFYRIAPQAADGICVTYRKVADPSRPTGRERPVEGGAQWKRVDRTGGVEFASQ
ncbi:MAG: class I SAM-dependent methyltransferase [Limisphaerales bacterium]